MHAPRVVWAVSSLCNKLYLDMNSPANHIENRSDASLSRHRELLPRALPNAADTRLFDRLMAEARAQGLTWIEGLEYVIECRRSLLN